MLRCVNQRLTVLLYIHLSSSASARVRLSGLALQPNSWPTRDTGVVTEARHPNNFQPRWLYNFAHHRWYWEPPESRPVANTSPNSSSCATFWTRNRRCTICCPTSVTSTLWTDFATQKHLNYHKPELNSKSVLLIVSLFSTPRVYRSVWRMVSATFWNKWEMQATTIRVCRIVEREECQVTYWLDSLSTCALCNARNVKCCCCCYFRFFCLTDWCFRNHCKLGQVPWRSPENIWKLRLCEIVYRPDGLPLREPPVSKHWMEEKSN